MKLARPDFVGAATGPAVTEADANARSRALHVPSEYEPSVARMLDGLNLWAHACGNPIHPPAEISGDWRRDPRLCIRRRLQLPRIGLRR
jgi:hypothetical protein